MANEITLLEWCKPDGAHVKEGDVLCIIGSDKATSEITSFESGILRHLKKVGDAITAPTDLPCRIDPAA